MKLVTAACMFMVLAQLAVAPAVLAAGPATGFSGTWATIDCATWWEEGPDGHLIDCDVWGDGSSMTLVIAPGDTPQVTFQDAYASSCVNAGSSSTRWVGAGKGYYGDIYLFAPLPKTGCGTYQMRSSVQLELYHDPGSVDG